MCILSNCIRSNDEKEDFNLIAIFMLFIFYSLKKGRWLDTNYTEKTFASPQTHLKNIKIEKWFTMNGKK